MMSSLKSTSIQCLLRLAFDTVDRFDHLPILYSFSVLGSSAWCIVSLLRSACTFVDATVGIDLGSLAPIDGARVIE